MGLVAMFAFTLAAVPTARAASDAETFVQQNIDHGLSILNDSSLNASQRRDQFRQFILKLTDMKRIATFTLGQYRRSASDTDLDAFVVAFTDYANAIYEEHLVKYKGQTLKITGSISRSPTDTIVNCQVIDPDAKQPINAGFRVLNESGHFVVVDVEVEGIWLAINQRDQFTSFLQQNHGDLPALSAFLQQQAVQIRSGQPTTAAKNPG